MIKKVLIDKANRLYQFPPELFSFTRGTEKPSLIKKTEIIDLGRFNWNVPYEQKVELALDGLKLASKDKIKKLKEALSDWFFEKYKVRLHPTKEIYIGGRISSMLMYTALAFVDSSDIVFVPEVGLPVYKKIVNTAGGEPVTYGLSAKNGWRPDFERLSTRLGRVSRLLYLNSPHNPTGVCLDSKEIENLIWVAARENIAVINDAAYLSFVKDKHCSFIGTTGGKKVGLEIYSFSYQFGLPQLPFGFAIGNKDLVEGLSQAATLSSVHVTNYYVDLALEAIRQYPSDRLVQVRKECKKTEVEANRFIDLLGLEIEHAEPIPFLWAKINKRKSSNTLASLLYRKQRILTVPGAALGDNGEGYVRFSLTASPDDYKQAYERVNKKLSLLNLEKKNER